MSDSFEKALLKREATLLDSMPVANVTAHRTIDALYGTVAAGTPRVTQSVSNLSLARNGLICGSW